MADATASTAHPKLNYTPEERLLFGQLFRECDESGTNIVTGDAAVKLFQRSRIAEAVLGEIWTLADTENRGFLLQEDFAKALRLIGQYQAQPGRALSVELALAPAPLPKFEGMNPPSLPGFAMPTQNIAAQNSGPVRVPPLTPERAADYARLFDHAGHQDGLLRGEVARVTFEKSGLPSEVLAQVWNLADIEQRGALNVNEFIIAMHLLASYKAKDISALPPSIPGALLEAAARRPGSFAPRPVSVRPADAAIPRQSSGPAPVRGPERQFTGSDWVINTRDKASFDDLFSKVDTLKMGYVSGEQAVSFFSDSGLPSEVLAQIWDLANIRRLGQLNKDEFAVAMYLIRTSRGKLPPDLPKELPPSLIPPSLRAVPPTTLPPAPAMALPKSNTDDLFGLDALTSSPSSSVQQQTTGGSATLPRAADIDAFRQKAASAVAPHLSSAAAQPFFQSFAPQSSFGQVLSSQRTADSTSSGPKLAAMDDLLGDNDPEISSKLTKETTDFGNMSNEISNLRNQMQAVQAKKSVAENELVGSSAQKKDMEARLSQFRAQYEQELNSLRAFEAQLTVERGEVTKLGQQIAFVQASAQDVKGKLRDVQLSLDATLREKEDLNQRIRQLNEYINQAKSELTDKQSQLRHQKGMTAISKKQAEKLEEEKDKPKTDESTARQEASRPLPTREGTASSATSMTSTNPFMRRAPQSPMENTTSPSAFSRTISIDSGKFDNIFPTAFATPTSAAPATSFHGNAFSSQSGPSIKSSEPDLTPSTSPPLSAYQESPQLPQAASRQMASRDLPLAEKARPGSNSTSVRVESPIGRYDKSTPTNATSPPAQGKMETPRSAGSTGPVYDRAVASEPKATGKAVEHADIFQSLGAARDVPVTVTSNEPGGSKENAKTESPVAGRSDAFYAPGHNRPSTGSKGDIEAAFASVGRSPAPGSGDVVAKFNSEFPPLKKDEFPPIQEAKKDESDTESDAGGFDDDFTKPSPSTKKDRSAFGKEGENIFGKTTDGPAAEKPSSVSQGEALFGSKGSNAAGAADTSTFPATPSETNRTSNPSDSYQSAVSHQSFGGSADRYSSRAEQTTSTQSGTILAKAPGALHDFSMDDFSTGFDDLAPAKEGADPADDDLLFDPASEDHEFSASFDSPSASKSGMTERPGAASKMVPFSPEDHGFERAFAKPTSRPATGEAGKPHSEWDDLMRGPKDGAKKTNDFGAAAFPEAPEPPSMPSDDPFLKHLMQMGYSRPNALGALEKFDYDIQKASDYLASPTA